MPIRTKQPVVSFYLWLCLIAIVGQGCIGPNCKEACGQVGACFKQACAEDNVCFDVDSCVDTCTKSDKVDGWECIIEHSTANACTAIGESCELEGLGLEDSVSGTLNEETEQLLGSDDSSANNDGSNALQLGTVEILSDNNGSGTIQPGERACLKIPITNVSDNEIKDIEASLTTGSPYVDQIYAEGYQRILASGESVDSLFISKTCGDGGGIEIYFNANAPSNTTVTFQLQIVWDGGHKWSTSFDITILNVAANLYVSSAVITVDSNGSGDAQAGETICVGIQVENSGTETASWIKATVASTGGNFSIENPDGEIDEMGSGGSESIYFTRSLWEEYSMYVHCFGDLRVAIDSDAFVGEPMVFDVDLKSAGGGHWTATFTLSGAE